MAGDQRKPTRSTAFPFIRQFTAPPFFMGLEDVKLRSELLLATMKKSAAATAIKSESSPKKVAKAKAVRAKKPSAKKAVGKKKR